MRVKDIQVSLVCPVCRELVTNKCILQDTYAPGYVFTCNSCNEEFLLTLQISSKKRNK